MSARLFAPMNADSDRLAQAMILGLLAVAAGGIAPECQEQWTVCGQQLATPPISLRDSALAYGDFMRLRMLVLSFILAAALSSCGFQKEADAKFGDQHFKTAISLIELHKVRTGSYPATLADLRFTGDWDQIALSSVEYKRLDSGYELNVVRGWVGKPELNYPAEFWTGLGLRKSNLKPQP
jgi:hypothetical protein